eukprot:9233800-Ditylum_brightwellii.AAC.1
MRGTTPRKVVQCVQPWTVRFKEHCQSTKRERYKKCMDVLFPLSKNLQYIFEEEQEDQQEQEEEARKVEQQEDTQEEKEEVQQEEQEQGQDEN